MAVKKSNIALHVFAGILFLSLPFFFAPEESIKETIVRNSFARKDLVRYALILGFFYLNYYYLIPKYLKTKRYFAYSGSLILSLLFVLVLPELLPHAHEHRHIHPNPSVFPKKKPPVLFELRQTVFLFLLMLVFALLLDISQRLKESERQRNKAELSYLKAQVNPHFLFNTLNTIYALAISKSPQTANTVLKLSGIMRFVLTEANREKVSLDKEIAYIDDYIELQRMRLGETFKLSYVVDVPENHLQIPPLLLIPLVENAFKHGVNPEENSCILIHIELDGNTLILTVDNNKVKRSNTHDYPGGLGLENVKERLEMLYKNNFRFEIKEDEREFNVYLQVEL